MVFPYKLKPSFLGYPHWWKPSHSYGNWPVDDLAPGKCLNNYGKSRSLSSVNQRTKWSMFNSKLLVITRGYNQSVIIFSIICQISSLIYQKKNRWNDSWRLVVFHRYQLLQQREHVLKRPDMYIGPAGTTQRTVFFFNGDTPKMDGFWGKIHEHPIKMDGL